jgi:hypothetical protein
MKPALFRLGRIVTTDKARLRLPYEEILKAIGRHQAGDWGDVEKDDRLRNETALTEGLRLWSIYHTPTGVKFWIITEADRSSSTVLLPSDY